MFPTRRLNRLPQAAPRGTPCAHAAEAGCSITAIGDQVAVREGASSIGTRKSRQYLLALDVSVEAGEVQLIARDTVDDGNVTLRKWLRGWRRLTIPRPPIAAYQRLPRRQRGSLGGQKQTVGRLLHSGWAVGRRRKKIYRAAAGNPDATVLFNLAVLLEDSGREPEAMQVLPAGPRDRP